MLQLQSTFCDKVMPEVNMIVMCIKIMFIFLTFLSKNIYGNQPFSILILKQIKLLYL